MHYIVVIYMTVRIKTDLVRIGKLLTHLCKIPLGAILQFPTQLVP
jgi:hypothetical protein